MQLTCGNIYHIYNRGINNQPVFNNRNNYIYFLTKVRKLLFPVCDILSYCLMPNHFHFVIGANERSIVEVKAGALQMQSFSAALKSVLSGYTNGFNRQNKRTGSLFVQNTKSKDLELGNKQGNYAFHCFNYVHQNPWVAGLSGKMEDWEFSSFKDYAGFRNGSLCNKELAIKLLSLNMKTLYTESYQTISKEKIEKFYAD